MSEAAITPASLVAEVRELASLPAIAAQINSMAADPRYSADEIGAVISQDAALAARLLRVANSPFFGLSTQISTVPRAIAVIGTKPLRDLALATFAVRSFKGIPNELVSMDDFWYHSLYCAIAARLLARHRKLPHSETLFVAGLLHDIGQLVLFNRLPEASRKVLELASEDPHTLDSHHAERQIHGFDHAEVGGLLLDHWRLSPLIVEAVAKHHSPASAYVFPMEAAIVHVANVIATMAEINSIKPEDVPAIDPGAWKQAGIKPDMLEPMVRETQRQFREVRTLFLAEAA